MRAAGRFAVAVLLASVLPASAAAKEEVHYLPGTGLQVKLDCGPCVIDRSDLRKDRAGREFGTDTLDVANGQQSIQYQLSLMAKGPGEASLCDDPVGLTERLQGARIERPAWLPKGLGPQAIENQEDGRYRIGACADVPGGALFVAARVSEPGTVAPSAEAKRRIGETIARLLEAARPARVELKKIKAATDLPLLAGGWRPDKSPDSVRLADRRAIRFVTKPGSCDALIQGTTRARPAFLPTAYYEQVATSGIDGDAGRYVLCLDGANAVLAEVEGPLSAGSPEDKRVAMVLDAIGKKILPTSAGAEPLALPISGLSLQPAADPDRRWVRTGEADAPGGKADAVALANHDTVRALIRLAPGACVAPGEGFKDAPDHLEWLQWRRENGPVSQHWCTGLYRGNLTVTFTRPAGTGGDEPMYELLRAALAAAQRKVGMVPATGLTASVLPAIGLIADLPLGWTIREGAAGEDFVENGARGDGSRLTLARRPVGCDQYLASVAAKGPTDAPNDKFAAPAGWHARRLLEADGRTVHACHELGKGASLTARLAPGRTDAGATWNTLSPLLATLAKKAVDLVATEE